MHGKNSHRLTQPFLFMQMTIMMTTCLGWALVQPQWSRRFLLLRLVTSMDSKTKSSLMTMNQFNTASTATPSQHKAWAVASASTVTIPSIPPPKPLIGSRLNTQASSVQASKQLANHMRTLLARIGSLMNKLILLSLCWMLVHLICLIAPTTSIRSAITTQVWPSSESAWVAPVCTKQTNLCF